MPCIALIVQTTSLLLLVLRYLLHLQLLLKEVVEQSLNPEVLQQLPRILLLHQDPIGFPGS